MTSASPRSQVPYGSWPSPFTTDLVVSQSVSLGEIFVGEQDVWWSELRPAEGGRVVIVRRTPGGEVEDILSQGYSARTRVHEYGGGAWWLHDDVLFFANWDDQRLYRFEPGQGDPPRPITPEPAAPGASRYADGRCTPDHQWVVCVREQHSVDGETANQLVALPVDGGEPPEVLVSGADFVSFPRISPDGRHLCWTEWNHPNMPWDGTELWVARIEHGGGMIGLAERRRVAGGPTESVFQPEWSPDGTLHYVSDRSGWWNLYRFPGPGLPGSAPAVGVGAVDAEIGVPQWVFGQSRYAFLDDGRILCAAASDGVDHLGLIDEGAFHRIDSPYTSLSAIQRFGRGAVMIAASPVHEPSVVMVDVPPAAPSGMAPTFAVLRAPRDLGIDERYVSHPEHLEFATDRGEVAYALYYPPANPGVEAPPEDRPPLVVAIHGGPTSAARPFFNAGFHYWTSRGFAVVDVNYRGSTGYGRAYRDALDGRWGVADVEDCVAAAQHLVDRDLVDPDRLVIRGGSAGGFTVLCALTFHDRFSAGASLYGIADLEALATDTHKFESRYTDTLVGPYPERRDLYVERSPIHHVERLDVPLIVLHGREDRVVPPAQAEVLVAALRDRGVAHAYLLFEGEQHGFRQATTIRRALEAELYFYSRVFGFDLSDDVEPIPIENL